MAAVIIPRFFITAAIVLASAGVAAESPLTKENCSNSFSKVTELAKASLKIKGIRGLNAQKFPVDKFMHLVQGTVALTIDGGDNPAPDSFLFMSVNLTKPKVSNSFVPVMVCRNSGGLTIHVVSSIEMLTPSKINLEELLKQDDEDNIKINVAREGNYILFTSGDWKKSVQVKAEDDIPAAAK